MLGLSVCGPELSRNVIARAKVDLIGRLAAEGRVRHHDIVLLQPEGHQAPHTAEQNAPSDGVIAAASCRSQPA